MAPIQRVARLAVIASAIAGIVCPNSLAVGASTNVSMKKSKASSVQPRNPARMALRAPDGEGCFSPAMSVRLPLRRLRHQPRDRQPTDNCHDGKQETRLIPAKAQLTDAEQRGIDEDASQQPAQKVLPEVARDRFISCELRYGLPSGDLRAHFPVELHECVAWLRRRQEGDTDPNQGGDPRCAQCGLRENDRVGAVEGPRSARYRGPQPVGM